jgi:hypothetical protein
LECRVSKEYQIFLEVYPNKPHYLKKKNQAISLPQGWRRFGRKILYTLVAHKEDSYLLPILMVVVSNGKHFLTAQLTSLFLIWSIASI